MKVLVVMKFVQEMFMAFLSYSASFAVLTAVVMLQTIKTPTEVSRDPVVHHNKDSATAVVLRVVHVCSVANLDSGVKRGSKKK